MVIFISIVFSLHFILRSVHVQWLSWHRALPSEPLLGSGGWSILVLWLLSLPLEWVLRWGLVLKFVCCCSVFSQVGLHSGLSVWSWLSVDCHCEALFLGWVAVFRKCRRPMVSSEWFRINYQPILYRPIRAMHKSLWATNLHLTMSMYIVTRESNADVTTLFQKNCDSHASFWNNSHAGNPCFWKSILVDIS